MRALAFVSLVGAVSCTADGSTDQPPTLEITSPARGTTSDGNQVTVTGRVVDDGKVAVTVNGSEVIPAADGTFSTTVTLAPGISTIETHAIDAGGHDVRDVRAVLSGTLAPSDGATSAPIGARVGAEAFVKLGDAIGTLAEGIDYTAAVQSMNPVYNNTGCLGAKIDITSVGVGNVGVQLVPGASGLATAVAIDDVVVKLKANFKVACIGGSTTITVRSSRARVGGNLGVTAAGAKIQTSLAGATVALDGFSIDVGGVPGAIENLLKGEARKAAENAMVKAIRDNVPALADGALGGLIAAPYTVGILGHDTRVMLAPSEVTMSTDGLFVAVDTKLVVLGGEGGMFLSSPSPLTASLMPSTGVGVAISDDTINQLFAGLWAAGALEQNLSIDDVGIVGALLDADARSLGIEMMLPPTVAGEGGQLQLAVGDLIVSVRNESGDEIQKLAVSLSTTLAAAPTAQGQIALTVGPPTVKAQVIAQADSVGRPLTDESVEGIVTGAWGVVGNLANSAMSNLPIPAVAGVTFGTPTLQGTGGYVVADLPMQ